MRKARAIKIHKIGPEVNYNTIRSNFIHSQDGARMVAKEKKRKGKENRRVDEEYNAQQSDANEVASPASTSRPQPPATSGGPASPAASSPGPGSPSTGDGEMATEEEEVDLALILRELRGFRQDNKKQMQELKGEIAKTNARVDQAESRIVGNEERLQNVEEILAEMLTIQETLQAKLTDLEGRSRRENMRIYGVTEGKEGEARSLVPFVAKMLRESLNIPAETPLQIQRAHRALAPVPQEGAQPRSIVVKFLTYTMKEEVLKQAWDKKGFTWQNCKISLDHDYAPEVLAERKKYGEARRVLKTNNTRFQTLFPARLKVHHADGVKTYGSAEEATEDLAKRGLAVQVLKRPATIWERIRRFSWQTAGERRPPRANKAAPGYRERLQAFRRRDGTD